MMTNLLLLFLQFFFKVLKSETKSPDVLFTTTYETAVQEPRFIDDNGLFENQVSGIVDYLKKTLVQYY